jgi:hypothetical protein
MPSGSLMHIFANNCASPTGGSTHPHTPSHPRSPAPPSNFSKLSTQYPMGGGASKGGSKAKSERRQCDDNVAPFSDRLRVIMSSSLCVCVR